MSKRDPLLDQAYLRLERIIETFNEDLRNDNKQIEGRLIVAQNRISQLEEENERIRGLLNTREGQVVDLQSRASPTRDKMENVKDYIISKQKIKAIKEMRGITGWGLKEAKEFCDILSEMVKWNI